MKLLRDVLRLRVSRGPFGARRDARVREFVVTVPAPLTGARPAGNEVPPMVDGLPSRVAARAA